MYTLFHKKRILQAQTGEESVFYLTYLLLFNMIQLILVDDHKIIRDGIRSMLRSETDITIVGEAANGHEVMNLLPNMPIDLVVMDINMPEMDGFETSLYIARHYPAVKVLVLSMLDHEKYVNRMLESGVRGYVLKNTGKDELLHAIRTVASGSIYIGSEIAVNLLKKSQSAPSFVPVVDKSATTEMVKLSKREMEVLQLMAEGYTNAEIADKLFTSKRTIESHRKNLLAKTEVKNTAALIRYALSKGIIE